MNTTEQNLEAHGYIKKGVRPFTPDERSGLRREANVRRAVGVALWVVFPVFLVGALMGLVFLSEAQSRVAGIGITAVGVVGVALVAAQAIVQWKRGGELSADVSADEIAFYELSDKPERAPFQWNGITESVSSLEIFPLSQRVWTVNGQNVKNGWDGLR